MRLSVACLVAVVLATATTSSSFAQSTLEKIDKSATLIIGTRTGSPPA